MQGDPRFNQPIPPQQGQVPLQPPQGQPPYPGNSPQPPQKPLYYPGARPQYPAVLSQPNQAPQQPPLPSTLAQPRKRFPFRRPARERAFDQKLKRGGNVIFTLLCLVFAILLCDALFFRGLGLNFSVLVWALSVCTFIYYFRKKHLFSVRAMLLTIPVFFLSFGFGLHYNPSSQGYVWLMLLAIGMIQIHALTDTYHSPLFCAEGIGQVLRRTVAEPLSHLKTPFAALAGGSGIKRSRTGMNILIGVAVAIPIILALLILFVTADPMYQAAVMKVLESIRLNLPEIAVDLIAGFVLWIFLSALLISPKLIKPRRQKQLQYDGAADRVAVGTFLILINLVVLTFVFIQARYLFGGRDYVRELNGMYSSYARNGFFEMLWVTLFIAAVVFVSLVIAKKQQGKVSWLVRMNAAFLCLCNLVIIASSFRRMLLYIEEYGLTINRVHTMLFMGMLAIGLLLVVIKCFAYQLKVFRGIAAVVITGICMLSVVNVEGGIAQYNVNRYLADPANVEMDVDYLAELSYAALPHAERLAESGELEETEQEQVEWLVNYWNGGLKSGYWPYTIDQIMLQND